LTIRQNFRKLPIRQNCKKIPEVRWAGAVRLRADGAPFAGAQVKPVFTLPDGVTFAAGDFVHGAVTLDAEMYEV